MNKAGKHRPPWLKNKASHVAKGRAPPSKSLSGKRAKFRRAYDAALRAVEPVERKTP